MFAGGDSLDTTNAVCSFTGTIDHVGRVQVAVYRNRIVYHESKGCGGCSMNVAGLTHEIITFRDITAMQRYIPMLGGPMGPRGINLFTTHNGSEKLTIKGPSEEQFNLIVSAWKENSWPKETQKSNDAPSRDKRSKRRRKYRCKRNGNG